MSSDRQFRPSQAQRDQIHADLQDLAAKWAGQLTRAAGDTSTSSGQESVLSNLAAQNLLLQVLEPAIAATALAALHHGADFDDVAAVLGVSRQAVVKRWGHQRRGGDRVAVVISRRDRIRETPGDPRGRVGEVGGSGQYDSDRGVWPIGERVRAEAAYAIVAVDGTVRRVYAIDPDSWTETEPRLWTFEAVHGRELTQDEITAAHQTGDLPLKPGDECPTRPGGAYRPHWY